jgi:hypothetical protein
MKTSVRQADVGWAVGTLLLSGWLMVGCASTPKVDWNSRVGSFTYDQVVAEMGPPDKSSKLSDGSTVAEWFVKKNSNVSFGVGTGFHSGGSGFGVGQSIGTSPSGQFLRLTFSADGKLAKWERVRH